MIITEKTRSGIQIHLNSASLSQVNGMWQAFLGAGNLIRNCKAKESIFSKGESFIANQESHIELIQLPWLHLPTYVQHHIQPNETRKIKDRSQTLVVSNPKTRPPPMSLGKTFSWCLLQM
jgi:hypothetical protein